MSAPARVGSTLTNILGFLARHGRLVLVAGLLAGVLLPTLAAQIKPYLPHMVATTLFLAALRIGPRQALGNLGELRDIVGLIGIYQIVVPLLFCFLLPFTGLSPVLVTALTLMAAAPSISGSPNLTIMVGHDPAPALRMLIAGTAVVPATAFIVFLFVPAFGSAQSVAFSALRLLVLIGAAAATAFALRAFVFKSTTPQFTNCVDGLSSLAMAGIVIGLMTAIGPALRSDPGSVAYTLLIACMASFGLQIGAYYLLPDSRSRGKHVGHSIVSGCRNNALFITALPAAVTDPLLLYIGCYQIPMYLTPLLLKRLYQQDPAPNMKG
jgi:ACR3 family arsenite transporter